MQRILAVLSVIILGAAIVIAWFGLDSARNFPWGTHLVTVSAVLLLGVVLGWWLRERQLAEEKARDELRDDR